LQAVGGERGTTVVRFPFGSTINREQADLTFRDDGGLITCAICVDGWNGEPYEIQLPMPQNAEHLFALLSGLSIQHVNPLN
jgi:predicted amidohydrolase